MCGMMCRILASHIVGIRQLSEVPRKLAALDQHDPVGRLQHLMFLARIEYRETEALTQNRRVIDILIN